MCSLQTCLNYWTKTIWWAGCCCPRVSFCCSIVPVRTTVLLLSVKLQIIACGTWSHTHDAAGSCPCWYYCTRWGPL